MNLVLIAQFVAALALLIIIHEFGHFIAAKLVKVEVEEFGIGFPPRMLKLFTAGGTLFSLNWLPLGGFVRPKGETDPSVHGGLAAANPWKRLFVLAAGPTMNLLAGVVLFTVIFTKLGEPIVDQVEILEVAPNSPAEQAGLLPGDLVLSVNDVKVDSMQALSDEINANLGVEVQITFSRDGQTQTVSLVPRPEPPPNEGAIGILMGNPTVPTTLPRAVSHSVTSIYQYSITLLTLPSRILSGAIPAEQGRILGYKGMFDVYASRREADLAATGEVAGINTLLFFATVTVSLGLVNLFPIPALDGGRILFVLSEIIFRRRIPPAYENAINLVSFALLITILIYVNVQDFVNPVSIP